VDRHAKVPTMMNFDGEEEEEYVPAVLNRPKVANHLVDESFVADTCDYEDHTFCGVMFDVQCKSSSDGGVPLEFLQIDSISIRGDLGPITVWTTQQTFKKKEHGKDLWELVYEGFHRPSPRDYQKLELSRPIRMLPGERRGVYVHSQLPGDTAIVYDNQRSALTHEDRVLQVFPGLAHLSNRPFGRSGMWGFPWRERREFVGRISYGVGYTLWNPIREVHQRFPSDFKTAVRTILLCARKRTSHIHMLQDEVLYYILNMCKHDWFTEASQTGSCISFGSSSGVLDHRHQGGALDSGYLPSPINTRFIAWNFSDDDESESEFDTDS